MRSYLITAVVISLFVSLFVLHECSADNEILQKKRYELGLSVALLLPNHLPDFDTSLPTYGPLAAIFVGQDSIQIQALYGAKDGLSIYTVEAGYRLTASTPYFSGFALLGVHYLHYSFAQADHDYYGGNLGMGFSLSPTKSFDVRLELKSYFQERTVISSGGGFSFYL